MKHLSRATLTLAGLSALAAIWAPGDWWAWLLTALLFLLAGAGFGASADKPHDTSDETGRSTGPHVRFTTGESTTLEQIDQDVTDYKRTYGKPSKENDQR